MSGVAASLRVVMTSSRDILLRLGAARLNIFFALSRLTVEVPAQGHGDGPAHALSVQRRAVRSLHVRRCSVYVFSSKFYVAVTAEAA